MIFAYSLDSSAEIEGFGWPSLGVVLLSFITLLEKAKDGIEGKTGTRVHQ